MKQVNIREAKTHLSRLLQYVAEGEEIIIAKSGVPVARLVAAEKHRHKRRSFLGIDRKRLKVPRDFNAPLPVDILADFWGGERPKMTKRPITNRKK
ncbi:MAG TPA: type II toxin-antitoxin system Phd/YefM family antitoxin [Candidatus Angelobacter sp.]|jgi:prevent-host-death family protein|nr:type II toxin-antitoxin system Phd/YefM family antitoxin [Candidatus Angelobacter sp.]